MATNESKLPEYKKELVSKLVPYARNSRTHSQDQIAKIAASIREFGFLNPIIVDGQNGIIAGHGRVLAAQKLEIEYVPVLEAKHLTDAQKKAYIIADNRIALDAGWDDDMLKIEFGDLADDGFDLTLTGFSLGEIANLTLDGSDITQAESPEDFKEVDEEQMECICPKCGYEFNA